MRLAWMIAPLLLFTACGGTYMDVVLVPDGGDFLQEGGNAGRSASSSVTVSKLVVENETTLEGPAGNAAILRIGEHVLIPLIGGIVDVLDLRSGEERGRINVEVFTHGTPAVTEGKLFLPTVGTPSRLLCISLASGLVQWSADVEPVDGSVCAFGDAVYLVTNSGKVMCFGLNDSIPRWTRRLPGTFRVGPAATDSVLLLAGENGDLTALALNDGTQRWRHATGAAFLAAPVTDGMHVVAANRHGRILIVDVRSGERRAAIETGQAVYVAPALLHGDVLVALSGGDLLWLSAIDGREVRRVATGRLPGSQPLATDNGVLLLARDGTLLFIADTAVEPTELARLEYRSAMRPLLTEHGALLVDEEGNAVLYRWTKEGGPGNADN